MKFYKRFVGDYRKKTARLTPLEHGVYGLLLDELYAAEAPLPLDAGELANIVGARTDADYAALNKVLGCYFAKTGAGWENPRALEEMEDASKFSAAQKSRADKRWGGDRPGNAEAMPDGYRGGTVSALPVEYPKHASHSHSQTPQPQPKPDSITTAIKKGPSARLPTRPAEELDFESFKAAYPKRTGAQPWAKAVKAANARIKGGAHFCAMIDGARRYAAFCEATDKSGTEFVMQAATFLGPEQHFMEPWDLPPSKSEALERRNHQHAVDFIKDRDHD